MRLLKPQDHGREVALLTADSLPARHLQCNSHIKQGGATERVQSKELTECAGWPQGQGVCANILLAVSVRVLARCAVNRWALRKACCLSHLVELANWLKPERGEKGPCLSKKEF